MTRLLGRAPGVFTTLLACLVSACASAPPVTGDACGAARTVLAPVIAAALEQGGRVEIETRTALIPPASDEARWRRIRDFGFTPVWRRAETDQALRAAYWRAWRDLEPDLRFGQPDIADRRAWESAYDAVGDDRVYPADALWSAFFTRNQRSAALTCAPELAQMTGAILVDADAPRAPGAMRLTPAAPGLSQGRALMAARAVYPPLQEGGEARETGTIWLLRLSESGEWRVLSARRMEAMGERRLP